MSLGMRALTASYAALQATGHNIANANVDGYSRQSVVLETAGGQFTGAGFFGKGVDVTGVVRAHDAFLTREAASARALASMDAARLTQLERLEDVFPPGEQGLGYAASNLLNSMLDLSNRPYDASTRQVVLARAGDLASRFSAAGAALDDRQQGVNAELRAAASEVNSLAKAIAEANERVAAMKGLGQPANDLLDERDRLIAQLSEKISVTRIEAEDGSMGIFIGGGQRLVLGADAAELAVAADPSDPMRMSVGLVENGAVRPLSAQLLGGGSIAGVLRFQNEDLVEARNLVGQMAAAIGHAINEQQALGLTLQPPLGSTAGPPMFAVGAPMAIAHASNARDGAGVPLTAVTLTITDASALEASDYDLVPDLATPGNYQLTRLSDGLVRSIASGDTVDGMRIDVGPPAASPGDRFLLQPVARAANNFRALLDDPRDLAAAASLIAVANPANVGTATVASLQVTSSPLPVPGATARVTFTDDVGGYDWELYDSTNTLVASGSGTWSAGTPVPQPPTDINGFSLKLAGAPRNGDVIDIQPTPAGAITTNNGNALALLALRDEPLVDGLNAVDAYAQAMSRIGVRVQGTRSAVDLSSAVSAQSEQALAGRTGVNLDEEAARLIAYQQSYQAAAKVLQVAQAIFETLLQTAGAR
ncbi:MAG: flagellar hook-associated protein FlgK [Burkholderiales bacterium]|nr:flagellar hook-associated protein FlgK [Burkholderiales bacterium]